MRYINSSNEEKPRGIPELNGMSGYAGCSGPTGSPGIIATPEEIEFVYKVLSEYDYTGKLRTAREKLEELDKKLSKPLCTDKHKKCGYEKPKKHWLERFHIWRVNGHRSSSG